MVKLLPVLLLTLSTCMQHNITFTYLRPIKFLALRMFLKKEQQHRFAM